MHDIIFISANKDTELFKDFKKKYPFAKQASTYIEAKNKAFTKLFWLVWADVIVDKNFNFKYDVPEWDHCYIHVFKNAEYYDGICLASKSADVSEREFKHRFFINKKEVDIVASTPKQYDVFEIDSYDQYIDASKMSTTEMFWIVPKEVEPAADFDFTLYFSHHNSYDRNMNHVFQHLLNGNVTYNGIMLMSKNKLVTKKEIDYRFLVEKKQYDILASKNKPYSIIFISYNEPNADYNFKKLLAKVKRPVERVDNIKGIHNAHKAAAELSTTEMFWVVDADAVIADTFDFNFEITRYERDIVHVWQSQNPVNDLVYGYGGVKLLPKQLVLTMDMTSSDMTTSISDRFKAMDSVSNITSFNTDPLSAWRSAFRECCKLASRSIQGQLNAETTSRLSTWCSVGADKQYGEYAIKGAIAGKAYGEKNAGDQPALSLINDFDWLTQQYVLSQ